MNCVAPTAMPRSASSSLTTSAIRRMWSALSTLVTASACTRGEIAASRSSIACRHGRLMRTITSAPPRATFSAVAARSRRAAGRSAIGTLSSRSTMIASAPRLCAPSMKRGTFAGT